MPERDLWQAVLMAQIEDAVSPAHIGNSGGDKARRSAEARKYLTTPSKDLETVCSFAGVDMEALIDRMRRRIAELPPLEPAPTCGSTPSAERPKRVRGILIEHDGRSLSVMKWAEITGITESVIRARLRKGWTVADALTVPLNTPRQNPAHTITHAGETLTYRQWAERTGLSWFTIRERVNKGWLVEEVLRPGDLRGLCSKRLR